MPTAARNRGLALFAAALLVAGCASVADVTGTATQQDLVDIRTQITALEASVRQLKGQPGAVPPQVEGRLRDQAGESERRTAALAERLDGLSTSLTTVTQRVDDLAARVEALSRQLRLPATLPGLSAPPAATAPAPTAMPLRPPTTAAPAPGAQASVPPPTAAPAQPPAPTAMPAPAPPRPTTGALQPQDLYQAAYIDFSKGSYTLAINGFREFLRRYPDHPLAASAQYWIGEADLSLARGYADSGQNDRAGQMLQQAVQEFRKVLANYPRGDKAPTALYKEALTLLELKQPALAQARLQYLVENFPQAEEAPLARERLAALKER